MTPVSNADIGFVGLAVMGQNLVLNLADHGFRVAVHNRTPSVTEAFMIGDGDRPEIAAAASLEELVAMLAAPRKVMLMVKAGDPVDAFIERLVPLLDPGDIIIDGGNSLFTDTVRRTAAAEAAGLRFIGAGVSGGEEGARRGPSIMPGGSGSAWPEVAEMFTSIAATTPDGVACCDWVGPDGAGHYVKMVHNGIEYGDMQLIAEAYHLLGAGLGLTHPEMAAIFREWDGGVLGSFLVEITADILAVIDENGPRVEQILDAAGQKGTGKWTVISSMHLGAPTTLVAEAVYARVVSAFPEDRAAAAALLTGPETGIDAEDGFVQAVHDALYASKIVSYAQGFTLIAAAAEEHGWDLDRGRIAQLWRSGCIIRARFLDDITAAFGRDPGLPSLLVDPFFADALARCQDGWRRVVSVAVRAGIPVPAYASALAFYDAYRSRRLPANLIQAQRDYFGAHTYERVDRPRGSFFHTRWADADAPEVPVG
jgi:6-phosphogluconate dehydrogenase